VLGVIAFSFVTTLGGRKRAMSCKRAIRLGFAFFASSAWCQRISKVDRGRAEDMLLAVRDEAAQALRWPEAAGTRLECETRGGEAANQ
jgi:hypothetical protein